jgi:nitrite reductase/ring-hydroxylating ferredoxin subunit
MPECLFVYKPFFNLSASAGRPVAATSEAKVEDNFIPVMRPEDLPKGNWTAVSFLLSTISPTIPVRQQFWQQLNVFSSPSLFFLFIGVRKEVRVEGKSVLIFWYRNQIYAIEARSPAEGAYSEGFIRAKFTQDYAIECPSTGTLFSLKDGSIVQWYPNNPVLRMLTPAPTCRRMEIYPVKLTQDAISVDVSDAMAQTVTSSLTKGGSDTSLENNNVYGLEPKVYVEGEDTPDGGSAIAQVATAAVAVLAVVSVGAVGVAVFKYISQ